MKSWRLIYLLLSALGLVLPWWFNLQYFAGVGSVATALLPQTFFGMAMANPLTSAITLDVYIAAIVFSVWVMAESQRLQLTRSWVYILACFTVGLSFAFPLFLAMREASFPEAHATSKTDNNN